MDPDEFSEIAEVAFQAYRDAVMELVDDRGLDAHEAQTMLAAYFDERRAEEDMVSLTESEVERDGHVYTQPDHIRFIRDVEDAGFEVQHYRGRFFWSGPAVDCDSVSDVTSVTRVRCQSDNLGLGYIVYPVQGE